MKHYYLFRHVKKPMQHPCEGLSTSFASVDPPRSQNAADRKIPRVSFFFARIFNRLAGTPLAPKRENSVWNWAHKLTARTYLDVEAQVDGGRVRLHLGCCGCCCCCCCCRMLLRRRRVGLPAGSSHRGRHGGGGGCCGDTAAMRNPEMRAFSPSPPSYFLLLSVLFWSVW